MTYPEHDKMQGVKAEAEIIGAFLEWLSQSYSICQWRDAGNNGEPQRIPADEHDIKRIASDWGEHSWEVADARANGVDNPDYDYWADEYIPAHRPISAWLAAYLDIDLDKIEAEKRAMLDRLRTA